MFLVRPPTVQIPCTSINSMLVNSAPVKERQLTTFRGRVAIVALRRWSQGPLQSHIQLIIQITKCKKGLLDEFWVP
jgi:hypothetical protein